MERTQEPVLLQSCDKILERIENSNLSDVEKNKIKKGEMSPFIIYGLDFDNDLTKTIFRHCYFRDKIKYKKNEHASLFGVSTFDTDLNYLLESAFHGIQNSLNHSIYNHYGYRKLDSFSQSASVALFKYGYFPYNLNSKDKMIDTFFFGETNVNSLYLKVILKDKNQKVIRIPLREIASKGCIWEHIKEEFGSNIKYSDILNINIEDVNYDISNYERDIFKNTKIVVNPKKDLEILSTFVPENFSVIHSHSIIQIMKLYLLFLVCDNDDKYTNSLYNLLNALSMRSDFPYSRKFLRNTQTCTSIKKFLNYLNNKDIITFESNIDVFCKNRFLRYPSKTNCKYYLNHIKYLSSKNTALSEDEWFNVKMVSWVLNQI